MITETVQLTEDGDGNLILPLSDAVLSNLGWNVGTVVHWTDNGDGSFSLTAPDLDLVAVLVETVTIVRKRYLVTVSEDHPDWALDSVTMNEVEPFECKQLDEIIVSHRVVTAAEAAELRSEQPAEKIDE